MARSFLSRYKGSGYGQESSLRLEKLQLQLTQALERIEQLEQATASAAEVARWHYLVARPHRWRRQLSIKGRNMTVGQLVSTLRAHHYTPEQASEEMDLPLGAVYEALAYYAENRELIQLEASEERRRLGERGLPLEPKDLPR